jgi:hypothetical protein
MKRILFLSLFLAMCGSFARGQSTVVTATVVDPNGLPYQAGFGQNSIQCTGNAQPYRNGSPLPRSIPLPSLDGNGHFQISLWDTVGVTDTNGNPLSCQWRISITDHCQVATFSVILSGITGAGPVDVSAQINAAAVPLSAACTPPGLVRSVTLGDLPPLFTVSVTGNPINPSFTFNLSNAAAGTVFGNPTGAPAAPGFFSIGSFGGFVTSVTAPANQITVSPTTGAVTLSFPFTTVFPGIVNAGQFNSSNSISAVGNITSTNGAIIAFLGLSSTTAGLDVAATSPMSWAGRATMFSDAASNVVFKNNAGTLTTGIQAKDVTVDTLTPGRCVEAGTAGKLTTIGTPCFSGGGLTQIATASLSPPCTPPSSSSFDACTSTLTWSSAFLDTAYRVGCALTEPAANGGNPATNDANLWYVSSKANGTMNVVIQNARGAQNTPSAIDCIGYHF